MKKIMKTAISLVLVMMLCLGMCVPGLAYSNDADTSAKAEALNVLSLFKGTDKGFELDRGLTRMEALIMVIRLTGNEWTATYSEAECPFEDAPTWENADRYLAYGHETGLVKGVTETQFDPNSPASEQSFMTLVLRALEYADGEKTIWEDWEAMSKSAGILMEDVSDSEFLRGDLVNVSYAALDAKMQVQSMTLAEFLQGRNLFSNLSMEVAKSIVGGETVTLDSELAKIAGAMYAGVGENLHISGLEIREITKENMKSFLGIDTLKIEEGIAIEPVMLARAHSVCLVRVKDGTDIEKAKKDILANVNPMKWICVGVNEENIRIDNIGNFIVLIMDNAVPDELLAGFMSLGKIAPDKNGMMLVGDTYVEAGDAVNEQYVDAFAQKLISVRRDYLGDSKVYYAIIPEKSFYAKDSVTDFTDHAEITKLLSEKLSAWTEIDLTASLELSDFYLTDPHWKQDSLDGVIDSMGKVMDFDIDTKFEKTSYDGFIGSYGRLVDGVKAETISLLSSDVIDSAVADNFQYADVKTVYDLARLDTNNPYDVFLCGATPLVTIRNAAAENERELVIFRDSFGGSIAPLLLEEYSKITLVDLRYMSSSMLPTYVDFTNAEVLFLFSDSLVNNMLTMK